MTFVLDADDSLEQVAGDVVEIDHSIVVPNDGKTKSLVIFTTVAKRRFIEKYWFGDVTVR